MTKTKKHSMTKKSVKIVDENVKISRPGLVSTDERVIEVKESQYRCSCGEKFDTGNSAYTHLCEVNDVKVVGGSDE